MATVEPTTYILESIRNQNLTWAVILSEFIDNSFDAKASRVLIRFDKKRLDIIDDGLGCANLLNMLTLGARHEHESSKLGRYGVGAKDAAISAADRISIDSVHKGCRSKIFCDWLKIQKSGSWVIPDPFIESTSDASGTTITLDPMRMDRIGDAEKLIAALSLTYSPAIRSGRQIVLQLGSTKPAIAIPMFVMPTLEDQISADFVIDGKTARIEMGLIPETVPVMLSGIIISQGYRVIEKGSRIGLGDKPTPRLFGWLSLGKEWSLTKNKTSISGDKQELDAAINTACRATIEKAATLAQDVVFDGVAMAINRAIGAATETQEANAKAKRRSTKATTGTIAPKQTAKRHNAAAITQRGQTFHEPSTINDRSHRLQVAFESMGVDGPVSRFSHDIVYLNRDIPSLAARMHDEETVSTHAIYAAATWFATDEGPLRRLFDVVDCATIFERMAKIAGQLLSHLRLPKATD